MLKEAILSCAMALPPASIHDEAFLLLIHFIHNRYPGYEVMRISDPKIRVGGEWERVPFTHQGMTVWIRKAA